MHPYHFHFYLEAFDLEQIPDARREENLGLGVWVTIIPFSSNNSVLTKPTAEIWKHNEVTQKLTIKQTNPGVRKIAFRSKLF